METEKEQNQKMAPIALFVYNRLENVKKTVESLQLNALAKESEFYIFSDGAKNPDNEEKVRAVREYIKTIDRFKSVTIKESPNNLGLATSIVRGVTEVVNKFGKVIVLEDDLMLSPYFLQFMNDALNLYEKDERVMIINGYLPALNQKYKLPETFFLNFMSSWGWATWKRAWDTFNPDSKMLLEQIKKISGEYRFNIDGSHSFLHHLKANVIGRWNTWAIKWYASFFILNGFGLFPSKSLVKHVGFGENATHAKIDDEPPGEMSTKPIVVSKMQVEESKIVRKAFKCYYLHLEKNLFQRYFKLFKENIKRIPLIKHTFDFLRTKLYDERNAV